MTSDAEASAPPRYTPLSLCLLTGVLGGGVAGFLDAAVTLARRVPGLTAPRFASLAGLGVGLAAPGGLFLAAVGALLVLALRRRARSLAEPLAMGLLALPVIGYDAFALFAGRRAALLPGHQAVSVVLLLAGLGAVVAALRIYLRFADAGGAAESSGADRAGRRLMISTSVGLAVTAYLANVLLLPRLYPWFHLSLSLAFLAFVLLAIRVLVVRRTDGGAVVQRRHVVLWVLALSTMAMGILALAVPQLGASQSLRFAAYEKTTVIRALLELFPRPRVARLVSRAERLDGDIDEPALPGGPRLPVADVFVISIDALRADHVGAYGYRRPTTPHIDALAARSVRFDRAYAQAPHTSFSVASMLTGKYYPTIARLAPGDVHDPVTAVLRRYGWKTAAFYPPAVFFVDAQKLKAYQDSNFDFEYVKVEFLDAYKRLEQVAAFFATDRPGRAFVWLHLFEPHEPYDDRAGFSFGSRDIDRYDSEIAYTDAAVGKLVAYIEKTRPGAIIVLTADHGEEFDDHGGRYHGSTLFDEQVRVPLIIHVPGTKPHVVSGPVEVVDIAPTILGLLDIPVPTRMRGTDLGPWLASPPASALRLPPVFAEVMEKRMVVWGHEKLICDMDWGFCAYHDLEADPGERKNLADDRPDRVAALRGRLDDWLDDHGRFEPQLLRGPANPNGGDIPRAIARGRMGDLMVARELAEMLRSDSPVAVRREAARLLVMLPPRPQETRDLVLAGRAADDAEIRDWATVAAARLGDVAAQVAARTLVERTDGAGKELRLRAALALALAGDPAAAPVLALALDDCEDASLCRLVILGLGAVRDRRAVPALLRHLPEVLNRREIVGALGAMGPLAGEPVISALTSRLDSDEYVPVRAEAATGLGKIGGAAAVSALVAAQGREREQLVLTAIGTALGILRAADSKPEVNRALKPPATKGRPGSRH